MACTPSPCKHSGVCSIDDGPKCDCTGTGYHGDTCQIGIVTVPQLPVLYVNVTKSGLMLQAKPSNDLVIKITTDSRNLGVFPQNVTISGSNTFSSFKLLAIAPGFYKLTFKLFGKDASFFDMPAPSTVYVNGNADSQLENSAITSGGDIKAGCFVGNLNEYSTTSNFRWENDKSANGIIQVSGIDGKLVPLSFSGGRLTTTGFTKYGENNIAAKTTETLKNDTSCFSGSNPLNYIGQLLQTNAFMFSVQNTFNNYAPYWLHLVAPLQTKGYDTGDLGGSLFKGTELIAKRTLCSNGLVLNPSHFYYLYQTKQACTIYFMHQKLLLPKTSTKCFVKNIIDNTVHFVILPNNRNETATIDAFSKLFSNIVEFSGTIDRLGFRLNTSEHDTLYSYGSREIRIGDNDLHFVFNLNGYLQWMSTNISKIFDKLSMKEFSSSNGNIGISLSWRVLGSVEIFNVSGSLASFIKYSKSKSVCSGGMIAADVLPNFKKHSTRNFVSAVSFSTSSNITFNLRHQEPNRIPFMKPAVAESLKKVLYEASVNFAPSLQFLDAFKPNYENIESYRSQIVPHFRTLINHLQSLSGSFTTMSMSLKSENIAAIRVQVLNILKRFQIMNDANKLADEFGFTEFLQKFTDFKILANDVLQKLKYDILYMGGSASISWFKLSGRGNICSGTFCFNDLSIDMSHGLILSDSCSSSHTSNTDDTLIEGHITTESDIGGLIILPYETKIYIVLPSLSNFSKTTLKGRIEIYNQTKETNVSIFNHNVSFTVSADIFKTDIAKIAVSGSLQSLARNDPVYFDFRSKLIEPSHLSSDINEKILQILQNIAQRLEMRQFLLRGYQKHTEEVAVTQAHVYHSRLLQKENLTQEILKIAADITKADVQYQVKKQAFNSSISVHDAMMTYLLTNCEPQLCMPTCIPGMMTTICPEQKVVHNIEHRCSLKTTFEVRYEQVRVNKTSSYEVFDTVVRCHTECPPLTGFFKNLFGKRRRRGVVKNIRSEVISLVFSFLGGSEGEAGASIGSSFGLLGALVIGSVFGSCNEVCLKFYIPRTVSYESVSYEKRSRHVPVQMSVCENILNNVKSGYTSAKACQSFVNCSNFMTNSDCLNKESECVKLRSNITAFTLNPAYNHTYTDYKQATIYLDLLNRKRDVVWRRLVSNERLIKVHQSLSANANFTRNLAAGSLVDLKTINQNEMKLLNASTNLTVDQISFQFTHVDGMLFPNRLVLKLTYDNSLSGRSETHALFTLDHYVGSVEDAANKIIETTMDRMNKRKRRALPQHALDQLEQKCIAVEKSSLFLTEVILLLKVQVERYDAVYRKQETYRADSIPSGNNYVNALTERIQGTFSDSDCGKQSCTINLKKTVDEIADQISKNNLDSLNVLTWNETLEQFFTEFEQDLKNMGMSECVSFKDCLNYSLFTIEDLVDQETSQVSKSTREGISLWKRNFGLLTERYPDFESAKRVINETLISLIVSNPRDIFCGNAPEIISGLSGELHLKEGENIDLKVEVRDGKYEHDFVWKRNNFVLKHQNKNFLKMSASINNIDYFSCQVSNIFGTTHCGNVFVIFYTTPKIIKHPDDVITYMNSPDWKYLFCNATDYSNLTISWHYQSFNETTVKKLSSSGSMLTIKSSTIGRSDLESSGYYFCRVSNKRLTITSRKASVHLLKSSPAVEQVKMKYNLVTSRFKSNRQRRQSHDTVELPTMLTQAEEESFTLSLAKSMNVSRNNSRKMSYTKISSENAEMSFILLGKNYSDVMGLTESWENISKYLTKDRENLLVRAIVLYYEANKTLSFTVGDVNVTIDPNSVATEGIRASCPAGYFVLPNGFMCGKRMSMFQLIY